MEAIIMIPATEYRVNNWVNTWQGPRQVTLSMLADISTGGWADNEPIPLTPEVLGFCGFKTADGAFIKHSLTIYANGTLNRHEIVGYSLPHPIEDPGPFSVEYCVNDLRGLQSVRHLHGLQNLYFALTGEELPVEDMPEKNGEPGIYQRMQDGQIICIVEPTGDYKPT